LSLIGVLAGCSSSKGTAPAASVTTPQPPPPPAGATWDGPPLPSADGTVSIQGFNEYAKTLPPYKRGPHALALEFLQSEVPARVTIANRPGGATVTVLRNGLQDDSVRADRYVFGFGLVTGGKWRLFTVHRVQQCQAHRGHQDFSPKKCV
jgi:hypothetical protein